MAMIFNSQLDAFDLYHQVQEDNARSASSSNSSAAILRALADGLSGSAGAAISNVATYPLDLIITRLQIQRQLRKNASQATEAEYKGFGDAARKIFDQDGWTGFYTGLASDTGKTIMDSFLFFLMYDSLRKRRLRIGGEGRKSLPALEELGVGFIAGSLTKLCTTPIANVVTRQQAAALTSRNPSVQDIIQEIKEEKGTSGFWSGYSASLVLTLNPSITFFLFETLKRLTLPRSRRDHPPPAATFLLAAISKACASSLTYPFSLAKARLQAGGTKPSDYVKNNSHSSQKQNRSSQDTKPAEEKEEAAVIDKELANSSPKTKTLARTSIFSTLLTIYENEGPSSLYEGVHLEIIKAFFSHGTTMLVKQAISRLLLRLYYVARIVYSSLAGGTSDQHRARIAHKARRSGNEYYDLAIKRTSEKFEDARKVAVEQARRVKEAAEFVGEYVDETLDDDEGADGGIGLSKWLGSKDRS